MILNGRNRLVFTGEVNKIPVLLASLIGSKAIAMSFWEQRKDFVSHL